ncbi:MAG: hypothetical protein DDT30_00846 [Dehalococcoidia bacterium]|nr:hypothetical protein [Bacillota bacterium]
MRYTELTEAVNQVISAYTVPLTLRQIYYRLVAAGLIQNTRSNYNQLSSQLVMAREQGDIDGTRIVDRSRRIDDMSFDSPEDFLEACRGTLKRQYVRRFWDSQPVYCEVWVEKDALSQVMAEAVYPFNTIVAPSRGYSSYSYLREAADRISRYCDGDDDLVFGKAAVILHFADHDPSGIDMSRDLQDRLDRYCGAVEVKRIALNYDQVRRYSLIPNPAKLTDTRSSAYISQYGDECWELDAIEPDELVGLCSKAVEDMITDHKAWLAIKDQDTAERKQLLNQLALVK